MRKLVPYAKEERDACGGCWLLSLIVMVVVAVGGLISGPSIPNYSMLDTVFSCKLDLIFLLIQEPEFVRTKVSAE
jgi:hypothetical protein